MNIYIGNDHGGYELKKQIMNYLFAKKHWVVNEGSDSNEIVRYPYFASAVACAVANGEADFGILICNTGIGMSIAANKYPNVRAAIANDVTCARLTREHNNANILCLGAKFLDTKTAFEIVDTFLETDFIGDRHSISLGLIDEIEKTNLTQKRLHLYNSEHKNEEFYLQSPKFPSKILLDTDMLTDCDDAAALALLLNYCKQKKAELLGVTVSSSYPASAATVSAINDYYGFKDVMIGAPKNGTGVYKDNSCFLDIISKEFKHSVDSNETAQDAVKVMRKALCSQTEKCVKIVTIGYMSNLEGLMKSNADEISELSGMELIDKYVSEWICMGGNFPDDPAIDNVNFTRDASPALYCLKNYTGKITFLGRDIGHNIPVGNCIKELDKSNPVRRAYELHRGRWGDDWTHHTADPSTILYAVEGISKFFNAQKGTMTLNDDCSFTWNPDVASNMSYIIQNSDRKEVAKEIEKNLMM